MNNKAMRNKLSVKDLTGIEEITNYSIKTSSGELVYFIIQPTNISVLSEASINSKIYALMTVLKGTADIEILCLNFRENFDDNKRYLKTRAEKEKNPAVRELLIKDIEYLDKIQVQMAASREFLIIIRLEKENEKEVMPYIARIEKNLKDQGFIAKRAEKEDIKKFLGVYYEQNVTTEKYENYDGERWMISDK